jgi:hypothetical protein
MTIRLFDARSCAPRSVLRGHTGAITQLVFKEGGTQLGMCADCVALIVTKNGGVDNTHHTLYNTINVSRSFGNAPRSF